MRRHLPWIIAGLLAAILTAIVCLVVHLNRLEAYCDEKMLHVDRAVDAMIGPDGYTSHLNPMSPGAPASSKSPEQLLAEAQFETEQANRMLETMKAFGTPPPQ